MGTDLTGLCHGLSIGQANGCTGTESITGTGGILHIHLSGRTEAAVAVDLGIYSPLCSHGDDHTVDIGPAHLFCQNGFHLSSGTTGKIIRKQDARLLLISHEARGLLDKIPALHSDAHIRHHCVNPLVMFFSQTEHPLDHLFIHVDFYYDTIGIPEYSITMFI